MSSHPDVETCTVSPLFSPASAKNKPVVPCRDASKAETPNICIGHILGFPLQPKTFQHICQTRPLITATLSESQLQLTVLDSGQCFTAKLPTCEHNSICYQKKRTMFTPVGHLVSCRFTVVLPENALPLSTASLKSDGGITSQEPREEDWLKLQLIHLIALQPLPLHELASRVNQTESRIRVEMRNIAQYTPAGLVPLPSSYQLIDIASYPTEEERVEVARRALQTNKDACALTPAKLRYFTKVVGATPLDQRCEDHTRRRTAAHGNEAEMTQSQIKRQKLNVAPLLEVNLLENGPEELLETQKELALFWGAPTKEQNRMIREQMDKGMTTSQIMDLYHIIATRVDHILKENPWSGISLSAEVQKEGLFMASEETDVDEYKYLRHAMDSLLNRSFELEHEICDQTIKDDEEYSKLLKYFNTLVRTNTSLYEVLEGFQRTLKTFRHWLSIHRDHPEYSKMQSYLSNHHVSQSARWQYLIQLYRAQFQLIKPTFNRLSEFQHLQACTLR